MHSVTFRPVHAPIGARPCSHLTAIFLENAPEDRRERFMAIVALEAKLSRFVTSIADRCPELRLSPNEFVAFLGRFLSPDAVADLDALRGADLYLVCAYGHGEPAAHNVLERRHMVRVKAALARIGVSPALIADIAQELRRRLVEMQRPRRDQKVYEGRGDLGSWLCVSAVREANRQRGRRARELPLEAAYDELWSADGDNADAAIFDNVCKCELTLAFREAIATLDAKDRTLLRYHFIDNLSIDRIGLLHGVHRATAARWINLARETLCSRTLEFMRRRISMSNASFNRMLGLLKSQICIEFAALGSGVV